MVDKNCQGENQKNILIISQLLTYNLPFCHRAVYYGTWCSPVARTIVSFCEGDVTTTVCETDAEFVEQLREAARWNDEAGYGPMKIDAVFHDELRRAFEKLGIADLLH